MWKRRLVWAALIVLTGVMYLFENRPMTLVLMLYVIVLPLGSILMAALGRKQLSIELSAPDMGRKNQPLTLSLCLNRGRLPWLPALEGHLRCQNLRTGEVEIIPLSRAAGGRQTAELRFTLQSAHCGRLSVRAEGLITCDLFGLTAFSLENSDTATVILFPDLYQPDVILTDSGTTMLDSDQYSETRAGNDPGEIFGVREYIPGDSVKRIHWKLSQKNGALMVREFGLPIVRQVLILIDSRRMDATGDETDAVTEIAFSLSDRLLVSQQSHLFGWNHPKTGELVLRTIQHETDLQNAITEFLRTPTRRHGASVAESYAQCFRHCDYAHVIVIGTVAQGNLQQFYNGNRVTQILPNPGTEGLQGDGTYVVGFSGNTYAHTLIRLEV